MNEQTSPRTWMITGTSSGFGLALAQAVLAVGDRVVATARRPETLKPLVTVSTGPARSPSASM